MTRSASRLKRDCQEIRYHLKGKYTVPRPIILIQADIIVKIAQCEAEDKASSTMDSVANILANDAANEANPQKAAALQADAANATAHAIGHAAKAQQLFDEAKYLNEELATAVEAEEVGQATANPGAMLGVNGPPRLFKHIIELELAIVFRRRQSRRL